MNDKFLVFLCYDYYPYGAKDDFKGSFETYKEALAFIKTNSKEENAYILDIYGGNWHSFRLDKYQNKWIKSKEKEVE